MWIKKWIVTRLLQFLQLVHNLVTVWENKRMELKASRSLASKTGWKLSEILTTAAFVATIEAIDVAVAEEVLHDADPIVAR